MEKMRKSPDKNPGRVGYAVCAYCGSPRIFIYQHSNEQSSYDCEHCGEDLGEPDIICEDE